MTEDILPQMRLRTSNADLQRIEEIHIEVLIVIKNKQRNNTIRNDNAQSPNAGHI